jgi:hypothetical protein
LGNLPKNPIIIIVLVLAGIGLLFKLIFDPISLIKYIAIIAIFTALLLLLLRFIQNRSGGVSKPGKKYRQAVKQSKKMYGNPTSKQKTKRKRSHLTVIDGKKNKNKNGAV